MTQLSACNNQILDSIIENGKNASRLISEKNMTITPANNASILPTTPVVTVTSQIAPAVPAILDADKMEEEKKKKEKEDKEKNDKEEERDKTNKKILDSLDIISKRLDAIEAKETNSQKLNSLHKTINEYKNATGNWSTAIVDSEDEFVKIVNSNHGLNFTNMTEVAGFVGGLKAARSLSNPVSPNSNKPTQITDSNENSSSGLSKLLAFGNKVK